MNNLSARLLLVLAAIGWGAATTATKYALDGFGPMTLLLVKLAAAAVVLWAVLAVRGIPRVKRKGRLAVLAWFEPTLAYGALTLGLTYTSATNASLLGASEACFVVALAAIVLRERVGARSMIGLLLAVVGVLLIEQVFTFSAELNIGDLLILGGNLAAAVYVIAAAQLAPSIDALPLTAYQFGFGALLSLPLVAWQWLSGREPLPTDVAPKYWLVAALIGGVGFAGSFLLYNHVIRYVPAGLAGVTLNLIPLFGVLTAVVFLAEGLTGWTIAGGIAVLAGIMLFPAERQETAPKPAEPEPTPVPAVAPSAPAPRHTSRAKGLRNRRARRNGLAANGSEARVPGVYCRDNHFNDPDLSYCAVCGIALTQAGSRPAWGDRPQLGVLVVDDGTTYPLLRDQVLGRAPESDESVAMGHADPLPLPDPTVSPVHARVVLRGWQVGVVDDGSAGGTFVATPGQSYWTRVLPGTVTALRPGSLVAVGRHQLGYYSHRNP
ncbi:EamA family transporter [Actinophytocola sp.]|uniref:EamA family transporter n=1 Tax=Actinophytocola sp. TaxID=1872138 RepID=UPI002D7E9D11|nr:EamA family transporter [Actinophytocola sp.]HET9143342.1 EamA family transporter [Actinophytocola sp.]